MNIGRQELFKIALFCAQELRAACNDLNLHLQGTPADIEQALAILAEQEGAIAIPLPPEET